MPSSTWTVTGTSNNSEVCDITAFHYDADGNVDFSYSSRLKIDSGDDIDIFVANAKANLAASNTLKQQANTFAASIQTQLNS